MVMDFYRGYVVGGAAAVALAILACIVMVLSGALA